MYCSSSLSQSRLVSRRNASNKNAQCCLISLSTRILFLWTNNFVTIKPDSLLLEILAKNKLLGTVYLLTNQHALLTSCPIWPLYIAM